MALKDHYKEADVLDALVWAGLPESTRIGRMAHLYLKEEDRIRRRARSYNGPTKGTVGMFIKTLYQPPHGKQAETINQVMLEIERQRRLREKRSQNRPYKPITERPKNGHDLRSWYRTRRNNLAATQYVRVGDRGERGTINCIGITRIGGCVVYVDGGGYGDAPMFLLRDIETGRKALYVSKGNRCENVTQALCHIAPPGILRSLFDGRTCRLSFEGGFYLDGDEFHPFRHIKEVRYGDDILNPPKPEKE